MVFITNEELSLGKTYDMVGITVFTESPPIELLVKERNLIYEIPEQKRPQAKKSVRNAILQEWQRLCDTPVDRSAWTEALVPNIRD
ncbi:hypothetical protein JTB14_001230 [Gonioctena quinquepunctata]|nr:hypothetical protein JTB14_001230 [Gonioctena quinquepunctata]